MFSGQIRNNIGLAAIMKQNLTVISTPPHNNIALVDNQTDLHLSLPTNGHSTAIENLTLPTTNGNTTAMAHGVLVISQGGVSTFIVLSRKNERVGKKK